jgi:cell division protein FtsL
MDAFEYAIKKDIRNNAIVREIDRARHRELWRWAGVGAVLAALLVCTAWQHYELLRHGYRIEQLQKATQQEQAVNRSLRLQLQVLRSPQRIAHIAETELHMVEPAAGDSIVIERAVAAEPPARSVVASR